MNPQTLAVIGTLIAFVAGVLASRGLISRETADYLASPDTLAVVGTLGGALVAAWGLWSQRPKARVAAVANTPGVQAVIAAPEIAGSRVTPDNVVTSASAAASLPGVRP